MPVRPKSTSPEPGIPLLLASSQTRYPQDQYGELESSASAEAPSSRRRGEAKTNGLRAVLGGGKPSEIVQRLVVKPGWVFLLVAFALGAGAAWILSVLLRLIIDWRQKRLTRPTVCSFQPVPVVPDFADVVASASLADALNNRVDCLSGNLRRHFAEPLDASGYGRQPADAVSRGGVPHGRKSRSKPLESVYSVPRPDRNH